MAQLLCTKGSGLCLGRLWPELRKEQAMGNSPDRHPSWHPGMGPCGWPEDTQKGLETNHEKAGARDEGEAEAKSNVVPPLNQGQGVNAFAMTLIPYSLVAVN